MGELLKSKYFKWGLTAFLVIVAATVFYFLVGNIGTYIKWIGALLKICSSLIIGLVIAYILNPIVGFFEKKVFKKVKSATKRRNFSIAVTFVTAFVILVAIFSVIIPQVLQSVISLINNSDSYVTAITDFIKKIISDGGDVEKYNDVIAEFVKTLKDSVLPMAQNSLTKISSGVMGIFSGFLNIVIGIVFAVYILANTRNFGGGIRKTLYAFFNVDGVNKFIDEVKHVNDIFLKFMVGKVTDSSIVCLCTFLFMLLLAPKYAILIAIIIGLTDLIPYFGPYIGTIPSALLLAVLDPVKAIIFVLFIICLQQIDSNLITPRIQSNAVGLPSFWVLFAIMLFGGFFKVVGLLIGVPCFTIIYEIISELIKDKLKKKNLPVETEYYESISGIEEKIIKANLREE